MAPGEYLITGLNDQFVPFVVEPPARMIGISSGFLQGGVRRDHLARDQILPDVEMFKRSLRCAPHSLSLGTSTSPRLSVSFRTPITFPLLIAFTVFFFWKLLLIATFSFLNTA
jgi:hypothetical protein